MNTIPYFVIVPLGVAFLFPFFSRAKKGIVDFLVLFSEGFLFFLALWNVAHAGEVQVYAMGGWKSIGGIPIGIYLVMDGLTRLMLLVVNGIAFWVLLYSIVYMNQYTDPWKYYILFLLLIAGLNGVVLTGDLFNLFVFVEIASISAYALVGFGLEKEALEASIKYQVLGGIASMFILWGILLLYQLTGTLNMADIGRVILANNHPPHALHWVAGLFLAGFGLKSAIVPFHAWLPDAHPSAPSPISAMLSGVVIKGLGIYPLCRIFFNVLGFESILGSLFLGLGGLSLLLGAFCALGQVDMKRLLAYSSINQIGFILIGMGVGTPLGVLGALFHLMNHAVDKALLFLNAGSVEYATGTRDMRKLGGLRALMPVTSTTFFLGSFAIGGLPPLNGFWSKLLIIFALVEKRQYFMALVAVLGSILSLGYFIKIQRNVFLGSSKTDKKIQEVPWVMQISVIVLAIFSIGMGALLLSPFRKTVLDPAVQVLERGCVHYLHSVLGG